jgi:hypothetical protein
VKSVATKLFASLIGKRPAVLALVVLVASLAGAAKGLHVPRSGAWLGFWEGPG